MEEKEQLMRMAMNEFNSELKKNDNFISGISYRNDLDIEIQVRVDYLCERFGNEKVDLELSKYRNDEGKYIEDIGRDEIWNTIVSNLED